MHTGRRYKVFVMCNCREVTYSLPDSYVKMVKDRSRYHFYKGLLIRRIKWIKYEFWRRIARLNGATIGKNSIITFRLAKKARHKSIFFIWKSPAIPFIINNKYYTQFLDF